MLIGSLFELLKVIVEIFILVIFFDYIFGWLERKTIAKVQLRHGPTYVGKFGLLQNLADILKLLAKENIAPKNADKLILFSAPPLLLALFIFLVYLLPYSNGLGLSISLGLLAVFVLLSFAPLLIFLAGASSGNKFSAISAQRSVIMILSYEIPLMLSVAAIALCAGSFNIATIVNEQANMPFIVLMPIGFLVFFVGMLAELERPPFDLREADSELIAGWLVDVGSPYYAIALFVDYTRMFLGSLLIALLFLGGWEGPYLQQLAWLLIKTFFVAFVIVIIRATTVRMRLDRLMEFGWFLLLPLSILNIIITFLLIVK
ncbi:MAG: complex I subunit 1 family protein [Candidatus Micrarchaeia archaeon]|jgi:NADH-quinone oxidoreductase subunit H